LRDWQFLLQVTGSSWLWFEADNTSCSLAPGDLALVPPGVTYAWGLPDGAHLAVHFDVVAQPKLTSPDMVQILTGGHNQPPNGPTPHYEFIHPNGRLTCHSVVHTGRPRRWQERFRPLLRQWARGDFATPTCRLEAAAVLAGALADWLHLAALAEPSGLPGQRAVAALVDELSARPPTRDLDIPALAAQAGLGETSFRRLFFSLTGTTPRSWLEARRIEHAAHLLRDGGVSVAAAASAAGYADPFHFARVFRRVRGCAPRAWRQQ